MAPTPQEFAPHEETLTPEGERVVISGMSGLFPQSHHVKELSENLYNKVNTVTKTPRWKYNHPEVSNYTGIVSGLESFDAQFFKVHYRLGNCMDSMSRKLLEQAYQAIYDAGVNPEHLNGKKVGVYTGTCFSETEKTCFYVSSSRSGLGIAGCSKTMFANRISYWLNAKGPSMSIDEACCSSLAALEHAYRDISRGECEAAVVGGANLCLHPQSSVHYGRIMTLCTDGKTKSFDEHADGLAKSEAINVLFLQRAKNAKRIYAEVLHVKNAFTAFLQGETGPKYGFYRDPMNMAEFIKEFYKEARVSPKEVEYVEAFGSAVPEADKAELEAIEEVYCKDRDDTLLVGSVMSNIGYGEAASGISAITKVLLGYQTGKLAANLHCDNPRQDIEALQSGRMKVLNEHQEFGRSYTAVNGISVTGVNAHVLLKGHYIPKDPNRYKCDIPRLVTISARQDTAVQTVLDDLKSRPIDPEEIALFHNIHQTRISGHLGRGYIILDTNEENKTVSLAEKTSYFDDAKRPLWFVYSGMGSQWAGMGAQLMRIPVFAAAIERCRKVLEPKGVDIVHIITSPDKTIFDNILNSFVGIAAVQIGLTDMLISLGIVPDNIIGHSVGELGCAYADGCFTAEEMILAAYSRGLVSVQTPFIKGSMAAVGIGYEEIIKLVPKEIEVACHNGPDSSTISGPADVMKAFVAQLTAEGIFAKEVPCSNIAYHSRYIAEAGPGLLSLLSEAIKNPKPRSERWLSTSVPKDKWNEPAAKTSSAQYHTNNLLNPVLFEETSRLIPPNAVLVEIAPHGLLQAILKRSLPVSCRHVALTRRGHPDNALFVLDGIGKLYMEGYNPNVAALYPQIQFPVSTGTPMLSHLVEWAHHEKWSLPLFATAHRKQAAACKYVVSYHDEEYKFLKGHVIGGKTLFPYAAAILATWDTLAMSLQLKRREISVEFTEMQLYAQPPLHDTRALRLSVDLHRGTGRFEILDDNRRVMTGFISATIRDETRCFNIPFKSDGDLEIEAEEVYQMFHERDHFYNDEFRSIHKANRSLTEAEIIWNDNWTTFLDGILQLNMLRFNHNGVTQIQRIRRFVIDMDKHLSSVGVEVDGKVVKKAEVLLIDDVTRCGGVLIENIRLKAIPVPEEENVALKALKFIPRFGENVDLASALQVYLQIASENINKKTINVLGLVNYEGDVIFNKTKEILENVYGVEVVYEQMQRDKVLSMGDHFVTEVDLVLVQDLSVDESLCQTLYRILPRDIFLINTEQTTDDRIRPSALYKVVSSLAANHSKLDLIKWRPNQPTTASTVVTLRSISELPLLVSTRNDLPQRHKLVILSSYPPVPGLKELVQEWRSEKDRNEVYVVMVSDKDHLEELPELNLAFNVLNDGVWGGEYYTPVMEKQQRNPVVRNVTLQSAQIGNLDSLNWVEAPVTVGNGIPVNVHYAAVNDIDVKRAMGVIPFKDSDQNVSSYGMDFSGLTDSGKRVMGLLPTGSLSSRITAAPEMLWPVPEHWSLEDAATVPSAYVLAYYCLAIRYKYLPSKKVLVHGGAGALGQAVISIALSLGGEVFTTVSDVKKKRFLLKLFPKLQEDHIGNSRDCTFGDMVSLLTKGRGVDIAISCVKGELKNVSLSSCGLSGTLMDVVQIPHRENYNFGMYRLDMDRNYLLLDMYSLFIDRNLHEMKRIQAMMSEGIAVGYVRPLSRVTYSAENVPRAFRLLAASSHRGRVLINLQEQPETLPRVTCSPDLTQLVICDEGSLSAQLAEWLVARGARKMVLHCPDVPVRIELKINSWQNQGVDVLIVTEDITSNKGVVSLLSESNMISPVEGIYVVATDLGNKSLDGINSMVESLDLASTKLCPSLRYFAVINSGITIGLQTCESRKSKGLPTTVLNVPDLRKMNDVTAKKYMSWRSALTATEQALRCEEPALLAHTKKNLHKSLLEQIAAIGDIILPDNILDTATMLDLGMELEKVPAVCSFLSNTHNVSLSEDVVPTLTLQQIREVELSMSEQAYPRVRGLGAYFQYVDPDELLATTEMVCLPTLTSSAAMRDDEFDVSQTYISIVPGMEGHYLRAAALCERLRVPALVLQRDLDHLHETVRKTAHRYAKIIMKKVQLKKNFYLLGYESGVSMALQVASILESNGLVGTVFCIGNTPEKFQQELTSFLQEYKTDEDLQDAVAKHMFSLMTGQTEGLDNVLKNARSWKEKIESCVRLLLGRVAHSAQYAKSLIESAYVSLHRFRDYRISQQKLRSKLILAVKNPTNEDAENLQRHSQQPIAVYELKAPLAYATQDLRCSAIVNSNLDTELIEAFNQKNICETYLINADIYMTLSNST